MSLEQVYSFTTIEGLEYRIGFSPFNSLIIPKNINKPVIDVVIAIQENNVINNAGTLFIITKIIKEYLIKNDVLLYCYCDAIEINRRKKHQQLTLEMAQKSMTLLQNKNNILPLNQGRTDSVNQYNLSHLSILSFHLK